MKRILFVGCGDIAMRVAHLLDGRYQLFGLVRSEARFAELRAAGIIPLPGDLDDARTLHRLTGLADTVLHFAPPHTSPPPCRGRAGEGLEALHSHDPILLAPSLSAPPQQGGRNSHVSNARSVVNPDRRTRRLLAALSRGTPPKRLIYISTSGVYGDCGGAYVSETHPLNAQTARAQLRADAERQIRNWAKGNHACASILRVPGIYAADRLPLERLRQGMSSILPEEDSYTNHIHADDLARIVVAALRHGKPNRIYHASDDSEMKMGDYFDAVADAHGLPRPQRLPRAEVRRSVSPALWSFMNESRRLTNERMKKELREKLRYPSVADGLDK